MSRLRNKHDAAWKGAFEVAARHLSGADDGSLIYLEVREDLRAVMDGEAEVDLVRSRLCGASARRGVDPGSYVSASDPSPEDLAWLARYAGSGGKDAGTAPDSGGGARLGAAMPEASTSFPMDTRSVVSRLEDLLRAASGQAVGAPHRATARYVGFEQHVWVGRAGRPVLSDQRRGHRVRLEVRLQRKGRQSVAVGERALRAASMEDLDALAERVVQRADERQAAGPPPGGEQPVVFAAGVGGILFHELVGHGLEGDTVLDGGTALARPGEPVGRGGVTVIDDPRRGRAPWRIDDEGEGARATPLIQEGRVSGCLHDLCSARRAGQATTGHGRRSSYREPVRPRMGCTFLAPGGLEPEQVVGETGATILVRRMEAASVDPVAGAATFRVTDADRLLHGNLGAPLDPFLLKVTTRGLLRGLDLVANDLAFDVCIGTCLRDGQPLATAVGAPTFRLGLATVLA